MSQAPTAKLVSPNSLTVPTSRTRLTDLLQEITYHSLKLRPKYGINPHYLVEPRLLRHKTRRYTSGCVG